MGTTRTAFDFFECTLRCGVCYTLFGIQREELKKVCRFQKKYMPLLGQILKISLLTSLWCKGI